jgi:hypothetical protein
MTVKQQADLGQQALRAFERHCPGSGKSIRGNEWRTTVSASWPSLHTNISS